RRDDPLPHRLRGFARRRRELDTPHARHRDDEVEPVEERSGELVPVVREPLRRAAAPRAGIAAAATRAQVHRPDELKPSREDDAPRDTRDGDVAVLERLAERLERVAPELRQLVEKQDAAVGKTRLARTEIRASSDDCGG